MARTQATCESNELAVPDTPPFISDDPTHPSIPLERSRYLSTSEIALCLKLHQDGFSQAQIAQRLDVNQSSICRTLKHFDDPTITLAKARLDAEALPAVRRVIKLGRNRDARVALGANKTILEATRLLSTDTGSNINVAVVIGLPDQPAQVSLVSGHNQPTSTQTDRKS